jgi:hypothetical protein
MKLKAKQYPFHSKSAREVLARCIARNPQLRNDHCERGCQAGSPNCAYHIAQRQCSGSQLEDK